MGTGSKPRFFGGDVSWSPQISQGRATRMFSELRSLIPRPDPRLLNIWTDLREFSRTANQAIESKRKLSTEQFSRLSTSVPHRLLNLQFDSGSTHELLRLSMLAYVKSILVQIPGMGKKMTFLADRLETALLAQSYPPIPELAASILWALFVAAVAIFEDLSREWLAAAMIQTILTMGLRTWAEARVVLKSFLWIDMVYDRDGQRIFEQLFERLLCEIDG